MKLFVPSDFYPGAKLILYAQPEPAMNLRGILMEQVLVREIHYNKFLRKWRAMYPLI